MFPPEPLFLSLSPTYSLSKVSFDLAEYTAEVDGVGTLRLLDAIRTCGLGSSVRFYQVPGHPKVE